MDEEVVKINDDERVREWESGLPSGVDLTPLSQHLIPPELASAFSITAEPCKSIVDVNRASRNTLSNLRRQNSGFSLDNLKTFHSFMEDRCLDPLVIEGDEVDPGSFVKDGLEKRKIQNVEGGDLIMTMENSNDDSSVRTSKRARLVWTPQLHKRFVDVVTHLGIDNAVPKTIMQLMNVEGLTRENVASHLQKYRLYLKRMHSLSNEAPSSSDQMFTSTPGLRESSGNGHMPLPPMPYGASMLPMPMAGMSHGHGPMGMPIGNSASASFEFHPYGMFREHQGDWPAHKFGSIVPYSHVNPNDK